jgi:chorismate-pyruvate lyase
MTRPLATDGPFLEQALRAHPGTVTEFLEQLAGESIDADKLFWEPPGQLASAGDGAPGRPRVRRVVVLRGRRTRRPFVYAESYLAADRVPPEVWAELDTTNHPIGRVLLAHNLGVLRRALGAPRRAPSGVGDDLEALLDRSPLSRSYSLLIDGTPAIEIDEWFLPAVEDALRERAEGAEKGRRT